MAIIAETFRRLNRLARARAVANVLLLAGFAWLWRASRKHRDLSRADVLLVIAAIFPFVYAVSPLTSVPDHAGYVVVLMPVLALLLCSWVRNARQAVLASAVVLALMAGSVTDLALAYSRRPASEFTHLGTHVPLPRDFAPLIARLDQLGISRVYASYWIAYRIDYDTGERIVAADIRPEALRTARGVVIPAPDDTQLHRRHPEYGQIVSRVAAPAFVIVKAFDPPSTDYSNFQHSRYDTEQVGVFTIYYHGALSRGTGGPAS